MDTQLFLKEPNMSNAPENPLLSSGLPQFEKIQPSHAKPAIERLIAQYEAVINEITALEPSALDYDQVVWAEAIADEALSNAWSTIGHLNRVTNTDEWRQAFQDCLPLISSFATERGQNLGLFKAYDHLANRADFEDQSTALQTAIKQQLIEFKLSGIDRPKSTRDQLKEGALRLSELSNQFGNHVMDATDQFQVHFENKEALKGLPEDALMQMAERAKANGKDGYLADLSLPSYRAIVTYADDQDLRERFYEAYATRASADGPQGGQFDNTAIVSEILALRHSMANLLGYDNHAMYRLEKRMANSVEEIEAFLRDLASRASPMAQKQLQALFEFAETHNAELPLKPWDIAYYTEKYREATLGINDERIKPYFEVQAVFKGLFQTAERLFGLTFDRLDHAQVWHKQVSYYEIKDPNGAVCAGLYLDIYARPKKAGGAWMDVCRSRFVKGPHKQLPIAYLTCNFAPPATGQPSLLTHDDVITLFHEFGHCLHHLLTQVDLPAVAGIHGVEWDAVELPSQLFEGWSMATEALNTYAHHYQTQEMLPARELQSLRANRQFQGALSLLRQIQFALTDLALHKQSVKDPIEIARQIETEIAVLPSPSYNRFVMSFSHLFNGGYSAGYYSYLWAERLARDAFELFESNGVFDHQLGKRLADEILSVGGSRPMNESWQAFVGRDATLEPLLRAYGIQEQAA